MRDRQDLLLQILLPQHAPNPGMKNRLLGKLGFEGEALTLDHLPETNRYANHLSWLKALQPLLPATVDAIFMQEINRNEHLMQLLVVSKVDVPEEIHEEECESFFILQGECACTIGDQVFQLSAGDYLDIPLHVNHDVKLLTPQVTAIVQRRF
jgi:mannose-6-phosphate isomerase-like protein (cupin superfamily)